MKVVISRKYNPENTRGQLTVFDQDKTVLQLKTLELPWLDNATNISCIPEGTYTVTRWNSRTRGLVFHVKDVPGRSAILFHTGNYVSGKKVDSKGCILPDTELPF